MMGMAPNPMRELDSKIEARVWTLLIVIIAIVFALIADHVDHCDRENTLERRIEALEKEKAK
jgi:hypothetical protein